MKDYLVLEYLDSRYNFASINKQILEKLKSSLEIKTVPVRTKI